MSTHYLSTVNSDLTGGTHNKVIANAGANEASGTISVNTGQTARFFTPVGIPGSLGITGTYIVKLPLSAQVGSANNITLHRINSSGVVQVSSTTQLISSGTGNKLHTFSNTDLGIWSTGDRLRIDIICPTFNSLTINLAAGDGANQEVTTPWTINTRKYTRQSFFLM